MLTSLSFLDKGQPWPPRCEIERLETYAANKQLFEGDHTEVYKEAFKRIERVIGNFGDVVSYPVIVNFQKKISLKTADFLWLEPPNIKVADTTSESKEQQAVNTIIENSDLYNTGYENTIDVSRYGDGVFLVYKDGDHGMIDVTQPSIWYPVVDPSNIKKVMYHVLAWMPEDTDQRELVVHIHEKGKYTERRLQIVKSNQPGISGDFIGDMIIADVPHMTGMTDNAVIQVSNVITSDRVHGCNDYDDVDSIISEILIRIGQISKVLDKHAAPSVSGPLGAIEPDPVTGEYRMKMGNYFPVDSKDEPTPQYITWDGQLEASFRELDKLINFLAVISEMGTALFDNAEGTGNDASSKALRMRYMTLLVKVKRIASRYTPALTKAIKLCSQLKGPGVVDLTKENISITWQDGLPDDDLEKAQIAQTRTAGKATMSTVAAIQYLDGKSEEQAEAEYERILEEEAASAPSVVPITEDTSDTESMGDDETEVE